VARYEDSYKELRTIIIKYKNIKWFKHHGVLMPSSPPHVEIKLNHEEKRFLIKETNARFIRWTNHFDIKETNFWYVLKDSLKGFKELSPNTRSKIRRGQKRCIVHPIEFKDLIQRGYSTYINAFKRYNTFNKPMKKAEFGRHINYLENYGQYEIWGVMDKQSLKLIGFSENQIMNKTCFYQTIHLDPSYMKNYSSYTLFYEMNRHYLKERGFDYVHDGSRNLSHETNIHDFLINKFRFRKAYCKLHIAYRTDVKILVKLLYPFRQMFYKNESKISKKIAVLLRHEENRIINNE